MARRKRFGPTRNINKTNLGSLPDKPGVYGIYTQGGTLQKVGRAKRYRPSERIVESQNEIKELGGGAKKFSFIPTNTVEEAKKLETRLIQDREPPFNKEKKGK